jgi:hypothetical protein
MGENKPNVFPTKEQIEAANKTGSEIAEKQEEQIVSGVSEGELKVAEEMKRKTEEQLRLREEALQRAKDTAAETEKNREETFKSEFKNPPPRNVQPPMTPPPSNGSPVTMIDDAAIKNKKKIEELSQPQMNQPYDVIPLPSEGKLYPSKKKVVKMAYLTTADENILTSPNLVESGDFLEILINRKLLEPDSRYRDLHTGARNAIMLWLRATGYGEMYPVTILDEDNKPFDTEINLSELKTINLDAEPDAAGLFSFELPLSKNIVKFKLMTVGELEDLEEVSESHKDDLINTESTILLEKHVVDVNGNKDRTFIKQFVETMRISDAQKLREYINSIESGVDMTITVGTPGGGSITTFLPLTVKFFWPNYQL